MFLQSRVGVVIRWWPGSRAGETFSHRDNV